MYTYVSTAISYMLTVTTHKRIITYHSGKGRYAMGTIVYGARSLRYELQEREGRAISMQEVANAVKLDRVRINKLELGDIKEIRASELLSLCSFYTERLGRFVNTNEILRFQPYEKTARDMNLV